MILDFSKAYDTAPHKGLLSNLEISGNGGPILDLLNMFLPKRSMPVLVDDANSLGEASAHGTVLGLLLFLCNINAYEVIPEPV